MDEHLDSAKYDQPDQITIKQGILRIKSLNRYLLSQWKIILLAAIIGGAIGLLYTTFKKPVYTAEFTFVLDDGSTTSGGGLGQYSALASMAGIDVGGSTGLFQGDNIIELYKSRLMIEKTLLTKVDFNGKKELLMDRYLQVSGMRKAWENNSALKNLSFDTLKGKFSIRQDSVIIMTVNTINKNYLTVDKPDKKLSIISVKFISKDPLFAKAFTETIVANVNKFYTETKTKGSLQNLKLFQHQADSIRAVLNSSIRGSAEAQDINPDPNPALQTLKVPSEKRQVDIQASTAIYAEAVRNLEVARGMLQRETPLIQVIDTPMLPLPNDKESRLKETLLWGSVAAFVFIIILIVNKFYKNLMN